MTAYSVYRQDDEPEQPPAARRPALGAATYRRTVGATAALATSAATSEAETADDSAVPVVLQLPDLSVLADESPGVWHWVAGRLFWVGITLGALFALWLIWTPKKTPPPALDEAPSWSGHAAAATGGNQTNDSPAMSVAPAFPGSAASITPASAAPSEENLAPPAPAESAPPAATDDEPTFAPAPGDDISRSTPPREPLHVARREPPPPGDVKGQPGEAVPTGRITNTLVPGDSAVPNGSAAGPPAYTPGSTAPAYNTAPPANVPPAANAAPPVNTTPPTNTVSP